MNASKFCRFRAQSQYLLLLSSPQAIKNHYEINIQMERKQQKINDIRLMSDEKGALFVASPCKPYLIEFR